MQAYSKQCIACSGFVSEHFRRKKIGMAKKTQLTAFKAATWLESCDFPPAEKCERVFLTGLFLSKTVRAVVFVLAKMNSVKNGFC